MALVVEDGTGLANAESYVSVADADTYVSNYMTDATNTLWTALGTPAKEKALRRATAYIDTEYGERWKGRRTTEDQALDWPRTGVVDYDEWAIDSDVIPQVLKDATAEMAARLAVEDEEFFDDLDPGGAIKRENVQVGPLKSDVTYAGSTSRQKTYPKVDGLLAQLLVGSAGQTIVERG
jgi:hypothetical protein